MDVSSAANAVALARVSGEVSLLGLEDLRPVRRLGAAGDDGGGGGATTTSSGPARKNSSLVARGPVRVCRFSPDGKVLAVGYDVGEVEVRDPLMGH